MAIIHSFILDRYQKFKLHLIFVSFTSFMSFVFLALVVDNQDNVLTCIGCTLFGMSVIPILSCAFEMSAQITYPANEAIG